MVSTPELFSFLRAWLSYKHYTIAQEISKTPIVTFLIPVFAFILDYKLSYFIDFLISLFSVTETGMQEEGEKTLNGIVHNHIIKIHKKKIKKTITR